MARVIDRAFEVAAATFPRAPRDRLAHPFGFGEHDPHEWRLSRDVWGDLCDYAGINEKEPLPESRLLGEYVRIDDSLPPNSMLLEPISYPYVRGSVEVRIGGRRRTGWMR